MQIGGRQQPSCMVGIECLKTRNTLVVIFREENFLPSNEEEDVNEKVIFSNRTMFNDFSPCSSRLQCAFGHRIR